MDESSDQPSEAHPPEEVTARVSSDGVSVRKTANPYGDGAVAVYVTINSVREVDCTVRLADAIPEPLRGHEVEFHPRYDPANWTLTDGTVIYTATLAPGIDRTTAYGITVDDAAQVSLFSAEPAIEVSAVTAPELDHAGQPGGDEFDFGPEADQGDGAPPRPNTSPEVAVSRTTAETNTPGASGRLSAGTASQNADPVEALVSTIRRRDLTDTERRALGDVLGADQGDSDDSPLESLRADLGALEDELATVDRHTADIEELERRVDALADDYESLQRALDRETRWRSQLQDSLEFDPDAE